MPAVAVAGARSLLLSLARLTGVAGPTASRGRAVAAVWASEEETKRPVVGGASAP